MNADEVRRLQLQVALPEGLDLSAIRQELMSIELELERRRWQKDPRAWVTERLGEHMWSRQQQIAMSVVENRRTAVPSCFESGKSWLAARLAAWWLDTHEPGTAFVVTTATTFSQVKAVLWREIGRAHAAGKLSGRVNQTEWYMTNPRTNKEELVAFGRKPQDLDATAFQGIHAAYVLVIFDEAAGISEALFEAGDSLIANEDSRMLAIGNPEAGDSEFAKICKPGSGWNVIRIPAFVTPNFTDEEIPSKLEKLLISELWVEEKRRKWTENSAMWKARVLAEFPESRTDGLIPIKWVREAQERDLMPHENDPNELGVDVGGGGDKSIVAHRIGGVVRIKLRDQNPDTMETLGNLLYILEDTGADCAKVDEIGIGRGLCDRGRELKKPIIGINVGVQARDKEHYTNLRAEAYWALRERFEEGTIDIDPDDEDLAAQLIEIRFKRPSGRIQIESKDEMKRRKLASPDEADGVMLAFLPVDLAYRPAREVDVEWG